MTLFFAVLIWFLGGGLLTGIFQILLLSIVPKNTQRRTPCIGSGIIFSLIRMALICAACVTVFDLALKDQSIKAIIIADVLWSALYAWLAVQRYGSYARRSGFRTGMNVGALFFGLFYFIYIFF